MPEPDFLKFIGWEKIVWAQKIGLSLAVPTLSSRQVNEYQVLRFMIFLS